jgi:hypothetical protein
LQVAASTAHLLVACKVKADQNSMSMRRLQGAGHAVKTATEHLVHAAKQSIEAEDERTLIISQRMVSGIAQVRTSFAPHAPMPTITRFPNCQKSVPGKKPNFLARKQIWGKLSRRRRKILSFLALQAQFFRFLLDKVIQRSTLTIKRVLFAYSRARNRRVGLTTVLMSPLQVMDAQEQVLRKERELVEARGKLSALRKAKYKDHPAGSHENSPDQGPYYSDY